MYKFYAPFIKYENCLDVFFAVEKVSFNENGTHATLNWVWMIQGVEHWWCASNKYRLNIRPEQYDKWHQSEPRGEMYV